MTSPTEPPKQPITERISQRISFGRSDGMGDPEERFTRNVTLIFVGLIVAAAVVVILALAYGFYDANLKPVANVGGAQVSRGDYEDRLKLETFRLDRAERAVRLGLADGSINEDLANRRLTTINNALPTLETDALERMVDLIFQKQLAEEQGITLGDDELAAALAADGTTNEARRINALVMTSRDEELGVEPTPEGTAEAKARAEEALAALKSGTPFAEVAEAYSPATASVGGDLGYFIRSDITDAVWADAVFSLELDEISDIVVGENGELVVSVVTDIVPPQPDPGFLSAITDEVSESAHERNVEMEALAAKLEAKITADALAEDQDQVKLAEILVAGNTFVDPAEDEGSIRASHILYVPGDDVQAEAPPDDDPAWAEAQADAERAAEQLRNVADPADRARAFAARAQLDSDGPTGPNGGDLGFFERASMIEEFGDVVFDASDPVRGDILGPVRTQFGWHVIMFDDRKPPLADRLAVVEDALAAEGADFAAVAAQYSDGPEALDGGETGWHVLEDLDDLSAISLGATEVGGTTEPVEGDVGYYIYLKQDEATRPLEAAAASRLAQTVFEEWYQDLRFDAEDAGEISIDESFYELPTDGVQVPTAPQGHGG